MRLALRAFDPDLLFAVYLAFLRKREDLLQLDARRRIYQHVLDFPGLHLREIARGLRLDPNHVKYHLEYLEKHDLVSIRREDGYVRYFPRVEGTVGPRDVLNPDEKRVLAMLRQPVPLHAILILLDRGALSHGELAATLGLAPSTLSYHVRKMEASGLVAGEFLGRERVLSVARPDEVTSLLVRYRPPDELVRGFLEAWEQLEL